jgi:hypothetical protein
VTQQAAPCRYQLSASGASLPSAGGTAAVDVTASSAQCEWAARSEADWLVVREGATGRGDGRVVVEAGPSGGPTRAATLVIGDERVTVMQGDGCAYTIAPPSQNVGASGGSGTVTVSTGEGCPWTATSQAGWITITSGASSSGNGAVAFDVAATDGPTRTGSLTVAGQTFTATQSQGCAYSIDPSSAALPVGGGSGEVRVTTAGGCAWNATSHAPWITLTPPTSGSGPGSVRFSVSGHAGPARNGTMTVAGRTFTLNQAAGCSFALSASSANIPPAGGSGAVDVTAASGCGWTATADPAASWVRITAGSSGSGNGRVEFTAEPNAGAARSATLTIAGQTFRVNQGVGCSFALSSTSASIGAGGGGGAVGVTAPAGCAWTATSDPAATWLRITAGGNGSGDGKVDFVVDPNGGPPRSATLTIAGQSFTVNQASGCSYSITPTNQSVPSAGGPGSVAVTTSSGCTWDATTSAGWISITAGASGSGSGPVQFSVAPNAGPLRTGTISVAGQSSTVEQASGCTFTIAPTGQAFDVAGGSGTITITTADGCAWTASSPEPWVTLAPPAGGTGSGSISFSVTANTGASRGVILTVAGQAFTVTQTGTMVVLESLIVRDTHIVPIVQRPRT